MNVFLKPVSFLRRPKACFIRLAAAAWPLAAGITGAAQTPDTARLLETAVVTAQKQKTVQIHIPYSTQTIGGNAIGSGPARTTPEMLHGLNGVLVQKTNHGGGSPFVRGLTGNQSLILIDGIRLNNSTFRYGPNQYLNTIDGYTVHALEVVKGTGSVQYGSDALGGVVQAITRDPQLAAEGYRGWSGAFTGKLFTQGMEQTGRGALQYSGNKAAVLGGITYRHFGDLRGGDTTGRQSPSGYNEWAYDAKLKYQVSANALLTLAHQHVMQRHVPVYHKIRLENFALNHMDAQERMLSYLRVQVNGRRPWLQQLQLTVARQHTIEERSQRKNGSATTRFENDRVHTLSVTAEVISQITTRWQAHSGIELYHDRVGSTRTDITGTAAQQLRGLYPHGSKNGNYSIYTIHQLKAGKWHVEWGGRYNLFNIRLTDTASGAVTIRPAALVGNAAIGFMPDRRQHIYFNTNTGFRAPNIDDMGTLGVVDFRYEQPNSSLRPERSRYAELGYKLRGARLGVQAAAWYLHLEQLITRQKLGSQMVNGYPVYEKQNTGSAFLKGWEAEVEYHNMKGLRLSGAVHYTYGQDMGNHEPLRRVPPLMGRLAGNWRKNKWQVQAEWLLSGRQNRLAKGDKDDNRIPAGGTPGWQVLNIYTGFRQQWVTVNAGCVNIFNRDYRTHGSGINGMGRAAYLSVTVEWQRKPGRG